MSTPVEIDSTQTNCYLIRMQKPYTETTIGSKVQQPSGPKRSDITYGAAGKSVVVSSDYEWSQAELEWRQKRADNTLEGHKEHQLIYYEVQPQRTYSKSF